MATQTTSTILNSAIAVSQQLLTEYALGEDLVNDLSTVFGSSYDGDAAANLIEQWQTGEFGSFPNFEIRSADEINGANGAFSADTNKIYISEEYLLANANNLEAISNLVLEEFGHFVDSKINAVDSAGDEGAIFSGLVRGESFSDAELQQLQLENDQAVVNIDGQNISIEQDTGTKLPNVEEGYGLNRIKFGDFDGDGTTDFFTTSEGQWYISYGGTGHWDKAAASNFDLDNLGLGDFDGDGKTDVFAATGKHWYISSGGINKWKKINTSGRTLDQLEFGDFDGDGKTDIFTTVGKNWYISYGGTSSWKHIYTAPVVFDSDSLAFGDFNGDGRTDIFGIDQSHPNKARVLFRSNENGDGFLQTSLSFGYVQRFSERVEGVGDFNGDGLDDILTRTKERSISGVAATQPKIYFSNSIPGNAKASFSTARTKIARTGAEFENIELSVGDFDNDGLSDILLQDTDVETAKVYSSSIDQTISLVKEITGNSHSEHINGSARNDTIDGVFGNDTINGGDGNDRIQASGSVLLNGGNGQDTLTNNDTSSSSGSTPARSSIATLNGGNGNDVLFGSKRSDILNGDAGIDKLHGNDGNDSLDGGSSRDSLFGGNGDDILFGGDSGGQSAFHQKDVLNGGEGNDILEGGTGDDFLDGGSGENDIDIALFQGEIDGFDVTVINKEDGNRDFIVTDIDLSDGDEGTDTLTNISQLAFGGLEGNTHLLPGNNRSIVTGIADVSTDARGNSTSISGGSAAATNFVIDLKGNKGSALDFNTQKLADFINKITLPDQNIENDRLAANLLFDAGGGLTGAIPVFGAIGATGVALTQVMSNYSFDLAQVDAQREAAQNAVAEFDSFDFGKFEDNARDIVVIEDFQIGVDNLFLPSVPADTNVGFAIKTATFNGQRGAFIEAQIGTENSNLVFIANKHSLNNAEFEEQLINLLISSEDSGASIGTFNQTPIAATPTAQIITKVEGSFGGDHIFGLEPTESTVQSGGGNYELIGEFGDDLIQGSTQNDILHGGFNVNRSLQDGELRYADDGFDILQGGKGDDTLDGGSGNDTLDGGGFKFNSGDELDIELDPLTGAPINPLEVLTDDGTDRLIGGDGNDTFVFNTLSTGIDIIQDFEVGLDIIRIDADNFGATNFNQFSLDQTNGALSFGSQQFATLENFASLQGFDVSADIQLV